MPEKPTKKLIPLKMHPRVFAALGADLVTSDTVAIIELVKNSYDALASNVHVSFLKNELKNDDIIEILDDGHGMTLEIIESVWCTIATPFRKQNSFAKNTRVIRRVSGEKGLGRLSVARLGAKLEMYTKTEEGCWRITVDWGMISTQKDLSRCEIECSLAEKNNPLSGKKSGTLIRIEGLNHSWDEDDFADLSDNLSRLLSPFNQNKEFQIYLMLPDTNSTTTPTAIRSEPFLDKPKYLIKGIVSKNGQISYKYTYKPLDNPKAIRRTGGKMNWAQILWENSIDIKSNSKHSVPLCGPFDFEIRAWDLLAEDTNIIAERHHIRKAQIRKAIRSHKGLSVYRDGILVLPKSDAGRDWLGLDLKRVSRVGDRISTSQIVGYIGISGDTNPDIHDTSDRERFTQNTAYKHFEMLLNGVVGILQSLRQEDRAAKDNTTTQSLFDELNYSDSFEEEVTEAAEEGDIKKIGKLLKEYRDDRNRVVKEIEQRFSYYSHLATIGAMAETIIHEIRARTGIIARFLRQIGDLIKNEPPSINKSHQSAKDAVNSLEALADRFSPLANRNFKRGKRNALIEERIAECFSYEKDKIQSLSIAVELPIKGATMVNVDPAEFDAIIINLLSNSIFWLRQTASRKIQVTTEIVSDQKRVQIGMHDSGPGVAKVDEEKIFLPGVTRRPKGIGMGLTVAGELVEAYGGTLRVQGTGKLKGASFFFDLPLA